MIVPRKHRVLLRFAKNNVLDDTSSGTEDEGRRNIVKILSSSDKEQRERMQIRVDKAFKEIQKGPLTLEDKKVSYLKS